MADYLFNVSRNKNLLRTGNKLTTSIYLAIWRSKYYLLILAYLLKYFYWLICLFISKRTLIMLRYTFLQDTARLNILCFKAIELHI